MNFKSLLLPLGIALVLTLAVQRFFFSDDTGKKLAGKDVRSGQSFLAPKTAQEARPLNREIDFNDEKRRSPEQLTEVETKLAKYTFSSDGASLERVEIKRMMHGKECLMSTVFPAGSTERENKCFLLALNEKTPYYYDYLGIQEADSSITVRYGYTSPSSDVTVFKTYTVYKDTYKLDLKIEVVPTKALAEGIEPRLFFPSPFTPDQKCWQKAIIFKQDTATASLGEGLGGVPSAVVVNEKGSVERTLGDKINDSRGWMVPLMFGADSKYFVHTMIEDANKFAQRAYYKGASAAKLFAIIEGPVVTQATNWTLSFYFGPKEETAMALVDERLEQTLDYSGWLAPIAKLLLWLLKFFYKYIPNYGVAIIILTILIKLLLLPFTYRAEDGMKKRVEMQKKMSYLEQKYKHDKETLAKEKAELIRKHGMPGLGGCLPLLLQIPIMFALSRVLSSSIEFYQAPFFGWITDLSAKDPYYVLPILLVFTMLLQGLTGEASQRFTFMAIALVMGAFMINLAAGLVLYIMLSTLLGVIQTFIQKKLKAA